MRPMQGADSPWNLRYNEGRSTCVYAQPPVGASQEGGPCLAIS